MSMGMTLSILSGVFWTIVYIDGIRVGMRDKSYAMPIWALERTEGITSGTPLA